MRRVICTSSQKSYGEIAGEQILLKWTQNNAVVDSAKKENVMLTLSYIYSETSHMFLLFPIPFYSCL